MKYLFDMNHAITHLNGDPRLVTHLSAAQIAGDTFAISTIVLGEIYYGAYASQHVSENLTKLTAFAGSIDSRGIRCRSGQVSLGRSRPSNDLKESPFRPPMLKLLL